MMVMTRRQFLANSMIGATSFLLWPNLTLAATGSDARFLFVFLRGGLDGLQAVPAYGDPGYAAIRGALALSPSAETSAYPGRAAKAAHRLDDVFALHPSLSYAAQLYAQGQFMPVVAAAPPYWGRSHFQAQDCVENGTAKPDGAQTGWLNRCVTSLPGANGLVCATTMPLTMRGPMAVDTWSPPLPTRMNPALLKRLQPLYAADPSLATVFTRAAAQQQGEPNPVEQAGMIPQPGDAPITSGSGSGLPVMGAGDERAGELAVMMGAAGRFMGKAEGPRVAFVENDGWDTHQQEAFTLTGKLAELDAGLKAFHGSMGALWERTIVIVATEFGRTVHVNGNGGTDHGTGGSIFLAGGALRGGRVAGQWPGVGKNELYEGRDVHATTDFRSVFKGVLSAHLGVSESFLETKVFPDSAKAEPMAGLVAKPGVVA